jgi:hypothetical protein
MPAPTESLSSARSFPWAVLTLLFLISLPAVTTRLYASDEIEYFAYLRSLYFDRDLSFDNEYRYFYDRNIARAHFFKETFLDFATPTGLRRNFAPIGSALLWAPFYAAADAGVRIARAFGSSVVADGFSRPYISAVAFGSAVYGFLALVLSAIAARRIVGVTAGTLAAVCFGTPLVFYMYVAPGFSHANSAFAVAAFVVAWLRARRDWSAGGVAALGALAALMGMVREQDLFIAIGPAIDYVVTMSRAVRTGDRSPGEMVWKAVLGVAAVTICFLPQAIAYLTLYGRLGPSPDVQQKMTWTAPNAWRVLVSPDNGWFFWTPLALPALIGLVALACGYGRRDNGGAPVGDRERRWIGVICLVMLASQIYVSGSLNTWAGAGSFGQRRLVGLTIFLVIGLAALLQMARAGWPRLAVNAIIVLSIWWNLGLIAQFATGLMDRSRVEPARNAYNNFVTIPLEFPTLAYRYVFDRQSFYQSRTPAQH